MKKLLYVASLVILVWSVSFGQLGLYSIGGGLGFVSVSNDVGSGLVLGVGADLGEITPGLHLRPDIGYWSVKKDVAGFNLTTSDLSINANVVYPIPVEGKKSPFYVGGGLGLNSVTAEVYIPPFFGFPGGTSSASESKLGVNLLAGAGYPIGDKLNLFGEARYVIVSDFGHFGIVAGVSYALK